MESTNKQTPLFTMLRAIIFAKNKDNSVDLATVDLMARSLENFSMFAVDKFIKGQKEHGGHITDRNLMVEIANEQADLFWYGPFAALRWQVEKADAKDNHSQPQHD